MVACLKRKDQKILSLIQRKWLDGAEIRQHKFIMDYYREHGEIMGVKSFCERFNLDSGTVDSQLLSQQCKGKIHIRHYDRQYPKNIAWDKGRPP